LPQHPVSENVPIPYEPLNYQKVLPLDSLAIRWTGKGFYDFFQLQVSTDSTFNTTQVDSNLNSSFLYVKNLVNHTKYYWCVRSILGTDTSSWSTVWNFEVTDAFITMVTPNGGENWEMGTEEIIRWETNILDSVRIDLLDSQQNVTTIDTAFGNPAYRWLLPTDLTPDTSYKIIIVSLKDLNVSDTSDTEFTITPPSSVETVSSEIPNDYNLLQNYPNPFNPSTKIRYSIPHHSDIKVVIYNSIGENIAEVVDEEQSSGTYEVNWDARNFASGIYFYSIKAIPSDGKEAFTSVRKMILLK
jgi:hypothetical protein